jgi:hypothetical protein
MPGFYSAFDAVVGLSNGLVVKYGSELPPAEQAVLIGVSDVLPNLVHHPSPLTLYLIGTLSWAVTVIAAAVALSQARARRTATIPLALAGVIASPFGPVCARTTEAGRKPPAHAASRVRGLLGWICWGDDVDGDLAESQRDTWRVFMPERHIRVQRRMAASTESVWALFADFPNLASHWRGLRATRAIGDQTGGVGARRRVELKPIGGMDETVTIWEEGRRIDTQNLPSASVPFKHAESTLTLEPDAEGTLATFDYRYVPRGGPLGRLAGPLIDKMLTGTFTDMLAATDEAARANGSER